MGTLSVPYLRILSFVVANSQNKEYKESNVPSIRIQKGHTMASLVHVYRPCGILVFLHGLKEEDDSCVVPHMYALQQQIADSIVQQRRRLLPNELSFLRAHLDLSKKEFGSLFGVTKTEVTQWESGASSPKISHEAGLRRYIYTSRFRQPPDNQDLLSMDLRVENPEDLYYIFDASEPPNYKLIRAPTV